MIAKKQEQNIAALLLFLTTARYAFNTAEQVFQGTYITAVDGASILYVCGQRREILTYF
jgi:hypothetical protein